jgi:hypothetical protein
MVLVRGYICAENNGDRTDSKGSSSGRKKKEKGGEKGGKFSQHRNAPILRIFILREWSLEALPRFSSSLKQVFCE